MTTTSPDHEPRDEAPATSEAPPDTPAAFRELPLTARRLVPIALDLLWRSSAQLRPASFYIGFLVLVTVGPAILFTLAAGDQFLDPAPIEDPEELPAWAGWYALTLLIAMLGIVAALIESRALAVAVVAGTLEGRPLRLASAIAIARRSFWRVALAGILAGIPLVIGQSIGTAIAEQIVGDVPPITFAASMLGGILFVVPFAYPVAGIVLGEVGAVTALRRSVGLFRARPRLALMVTLFGIASQLVLLLAIGAGLDIVARGIELAPGGVLETPLAGMLVAAALVFAAGTLVFVAEAIAATAQVHAFVALTHYALGLEGGRRAPLRKRWPWDPYVSAPLALGIIVNAIALAAGLGELTG
jgi:hypothetical protein